MTEKGWRGGGRRWRKEKGRGWNGRVGRMKGCKESQEGEGEGRGRSET